MLDNMIFKQLMKHSFTIPVEVTYPNGKTEKYGNGAPQVKIKVNDTSKRFTEKCFNHIR